MLEGQRKARDALEAKRAHLQGNCGSLKRQTQCDSAEALGGGAYVWDEQGCAAC